VIEVLEERFEEATIPDRVKVMKKGESPVLEVMVRALPPLAFKRLSGCKAGGSLQTFAAAVDAATVFESASNCTSQAAPETSFASRRALPLAVRR
jgi:hypothetical protein